jgi:Kelch motif
MGPDIREQLRRAARDPRGELDTVALRRRVGQLRRRRIGAGVAVAAVLVLAVPLGQAGLERLREPAGAVDRPPGPATTLAPPVTTPPPATTATTGTGRPARPAPLKTPEQALRALARLPRGWTQLPKPPGPRNEGTSLWVGNGLFLWGGQSWTGGWHATGWLFDPVARRWHTITPAPLAGRSLAAAVWTGEEVLVWGGYARGGTFSDGAAYDPATDTWRALPAAPLSARAPVATVWTGTEMVVWGSGSRDQPGVRDGAAFDPRANRWRTIAPAPVALNDAGWPSPSTVWTGREMIVIGSLLDNNNNATRPHATGLAYDPAADSWRTLPPVRLSPQASAAAWTGSGVLAMDYELRTAFHDPGRNVWRRLPGAPMAFCESYPDLAANGRVALAQGCAYALWDLRAGRWTKVVSKHRNGQGRIVAAGPVFLIAGASHESSGNGLVAYHP